MSDSKPLDYRKAPQQPPKADQVPRACTDKQETPMPPDMSKLEADMAHAAERERWREINALAEKADTPECAEGDPLVRRLRGRADFLRNRGEVKTPELLEAAAKELETQPAVKAAPEESGRA